MDVAGIADTESPARIRLRLAELLAGEEDADRVALRMTEVLGLSAADAGVEESFPVIRRFFEALAARRPLVVVFDDIHWGEATFLDLVEHLADWSKGVPVLLLCMARPELLDVRPAWGGGKLNSTSVLLEPLSEDECSQLVANLVGEAELAEEVGTRIADAAEGNPLFVEEMLSMLIDDGLLVREDGRWTAAGDLTTVPVPPTIQALLAARLDRLTGDERAVIERAAVEGKLFHEGSVEALTSDLLDSEVTEHLGSLAAQGADQAGPAVLLGRVRLPLPPPADQGCRVRVDSEGGSSRAPRAACRLARERRPARSSTTRSSGTTSSRRTATEPSSARSTTTTRSLGRRAAERLGTAGRRAFMRNDAPAGVNLISRSVALLSPDDPLRVELVPNVRVIQGLPDLSWADRVLTEAVEAAATSGDRAPRRSRARPARLSPSVHGLRGDPGGALRRLRSRDRSLRGARRRARPRAGLEARLPGALPRPPRRRVGAKPRSGRSRIPVSPEIASRNARSSECLVIALLLGPAPAPEAFARCEELLAATWDDPMLPAEISGAAAALVAMQGRVAEAEELIGRARSGDGGGR